MNETSIVNGGKMPWSTRYQNIDEHDTERKNIVVAG
jgi:hypothetical protein